MRAKWTWRDLRIVSDQGLCLKTMVLRLMLVPADVVAGTGDLKETPVICGNGTARERWHSEDVRVQVRMNGVEEGEAEKGEAEAV